MINSKCGFDGAGNFCRNCKDMQKCELGKACYNVIIAARNLDRKLTDKQIVFYARQELDNERLDDAIINTK